MIDSVVAWLNTTAQSVPLPVFVIIGNFLEEVIAPIPSPLVATLAGSITKSQGLGIPYLLFICAIATASKTFGAWIFYFLGQKFEHIVIPRFGKYIGVRQEDIDQFGKHFKGTHRDLVILTILRAILVMPSTPISVVVGVLNMNVRTFLIGTYLGFYIRNLMFMLLGFTGLAAAEELMMGLDTAETVMKIVIVLLAVVVLGWLYWKRSKGKLMKTMGMEK